MPDLLPDQFRFSHEFAFFLHDTLASLIVAGQKAGIFTVKVAFESPSEAEVFSRLSGEELWEWLENNGYEEIVSELAYKQVIVALLSDFCHFVYEALTCSQKGKLTVAYSLLRKPFKENLFYLEWLLADPEDFKRKYREEGASSLVLVGRESIPSERRLAIIQGAINKTRFPGWVSAEFIYDLRYSGDAYYGFDYLWNKATHLVTTFRAFRTEDENFNFVFSTREAHLDQWHHLYLLVPLLLYHTIEVVEPLIGTIADLQHFEADLNYMRRFAGFGLWIQDLHRGDELQSVLDRWNSLNLRCPECARTIALDRLMLESMYRYGWAKCKACHRRFRLNEVTLN